MSYPYLVQNNDDIFIKIFLFIVFGENSIFPVKDERSFSLDCQSEFFFWTEIVNLIDHTYARLLGTKCSSINIYVCDRFAKEVLEHSGKDQLK